VSCIKDGYFDAFQTLVEKYQHRVINTCFGFLKNKEDAEDVTQEVFIEVYKSIAGFREDSKLSTWIYRIAVTRSLDSIRRQGRKKRELRSQHKADSDDLEKRLAAPASNGPEVQFTNRERVRILKDAVDSLPQNQKIVITLNKYEGFSSEEIGEIMGMSLSAVEGLIHRAKKSLKKKLTRYYEKYG
ncbi:RNA polymerase sigma factor, partial [Acidobacteriota bacterium]